MIFKRYPPPKFPREWGGGYVTPFLVERLLHLQIGCCLVSERDHNDWIVLSPNPEPSPVEFEVIYGRAENRQRYNMTNLDRALRSREMVTASLYGFDDLYLPILEGRTVRGYLVSGPFLSKAPSAPEIVQNWRTLSGQGAPSGAEFVSYARDVLRVVVFEGPLLETYKELLRTLARVMAGSVEPGEAVQRFIERYSSEIHKSPVSMWGLAEGLVDATWSRSFQRDIYSQRYEAMRVSRMFTHAIGFAFDPRDEREDDPVARLVRVRQLQRRCHELALDLGETISGRLGDGGAFFLTSLAPDIDGRRGIEQRAKSIARSLQESFGAEFIAGVSTGKSEGAGLPQAHDEAVLSLEQALHEGRSLVFYRERQRKREVGGRSAYRTQALELRQAVAAGAVGPTELAAQAVAREVMLRSSGSPIATRAYFEALVGELLEAIEQRGVLEPRSVRALEAQALASLNEAQGVYGLTRALRQIASDLARSARRPTPISKRARLDAIRRYIEQNLHLGLQLGDAAREAGFSRRYFSTLFKQRFGVGFEKYLYARRLERAADLLRTTALPISRVGRDAGFRSDVHFFIAFKRAHGTTPVQYREQMQHRRKPPRAQARREKA